MLYGPGRDLLCLFRAGFVVGYFSCYYHRQLGGAIWKSRLGGCYAAQNQRRSHIEAGELNRRLYILHTQKY